MRTQDRPNSAASCRFYIANHPKVATRAADHCTLLHARLIEAGRPAPASIDNATPSTNSTRRFCCTSFWRLNIPSFHSAALVWLLTSTNGAQAFDILRAERPTGGRCVVANRTDQSSTRVRKGLGRTSERKIFSRWSLHPRTFTDASAAKPVNSGYTSPRVSALPFVMLERRGG